MPNRRVDSEDEDEDEDENDGEEENQPEPADPSTYPSPVRTISMRAPAIIYLENLVRANCSTL